MGPTRNSDRDLVAQVLAGDGDAFHELVDRHGGPIWSVLARLHANREDAREVFQETWLRAYERLATLREPGRLRSWLLSIALNLARQRGRRPPTLALEWRDAPELVDDGQAPGEELERGELVARMRAEIARLPPRQREVVELRSQEELSYAVIADLLHIREENARANFYQGMRRLRQRFRDLTEPGADR